jgi:hypothetical protein
MNNGDAKNKSRSQMNEKTAATVEAKSSNNTRSTATRSNQKAPALKTLAATATRRVTIRKGGFRQNFEKGTFYELGLGIHTIGVPTTTTTACNYNLAAN